MDDGVIRIGTQVDVSGIKAGMAEASAAVASSTAQMEAAYQKLGAATAEYAVTQANLRAVTRQLLDGTVPYTLAQKALTPAIREQVEASKALAAAKAALAAEEKATAGAAETAAVASSTAQMEAAYQKLGAATAEYAVTQANLRAVTKQLLDGTVPYTLAQKALTPAIREQVEASKALAAAKAALAAEEKAAAGAAETAAVATGNLTNRFYAAQGASRLLKGELPTRAFERLVSQVPMLGKVLENAFPLMGLAAFGMMAVQVGRELYEAFDVGGQKARELQLDIAKTSESLEKQNVDLQVQIDKLDAETARIEHKPINGVQMALDEASAAALRLQERLRADNDELLSLMKNQAFGGSWAQRAIGTMPGSQDLKTIVEQHQIHLSQQSTPEGKQQENQRTSAVLQERLNNLLATWGNEQERANALRSLGGKLTQQISEMSLSAASKDIENTRAILAGINGQITAAKEYIQLQKSEADHAKAQEKEEKDRIAKAGERRAEAEARRKAAAEKRAQEERIRADRAALDAIRSVHALTEVEESQYWANVAALAKYGSLEYTTAIDEANKATARSLQHSAEELKNYDFSETWEKLQKADDDYDNKKAALSLSLAESDSRIQEANDKASASIAQATVRSEEATGSLTPLAAAYATAAIHAKEYADELKRINDEITKVSSEQPKTIEEQTQKNNKLGQLQAQKAGIQGAAATTKIQDNTTIQQQIEAPYLKAFDQINSSWIRVQDQMMYSTRNLSLEFAKMGQSILISVVNSFEQMALKSAEHDLLMLVHRRITNAAMTASDAQQAAQSGAIAQTSQLKKMGLEIAGLFHHQSIKTAEVVADQTAAVGQATAAATGAIAATTATTTAATAQITAHAGTAAAGAAASQASIPWVGPALAIAAAAAMMGLVMGFAKFEDGTGYIPRTGMAMLHEGEAVIPAPTMQELRGSSGGGDVTINQSNNWNTMTDREFQRQLDRHAAYVAGAVKKHMRQGGR